MSLESKLNYEGKGILNKLSNKIKKSVVTKAVTYGLAGSLALGSFGLSWPNIKLGIIKEDLEDNKVLECAVFARADYIISGDKHLLNLGKIDNIKILKSTEFLSKFS